MTIDTIDAAAKKAAELATAETAFHRAHARYLEASDFFRRCSLERDRLRQELEAMTKDHQRREALSEFQQEEKTQ